MDLGWIEFSVIIGCGLIGFFVVNAVLESRRFENGTSNQDGAGAGSEQSEKARRSEDEEVPRPEKSDPSWWDILGVSEQASSDEIKSAFRREITRYHPDRVEGLGRELRELAEQRAKEINLAYAVAKRELRFG
jgi:hypothetical protein